MPYDHFPFPSFPPPPPPPLKYSKNKELAALRQHLGWARRLCLLPIRAGPVAAQQQDIGADWKDVPSGIQAGQSFRLLFVTKTLTRTREHGIDLYNGKVQAQAFNDLKLRPFQAEFRTLLSTASISAWDNTGTNPTTGTGVPIHWLGGAQVAANREVFDVFPGQHFST